MLEHEKRCKEILNLLGNTKTKVIKTEDIKGSYYVYMTDTIYLSQNNSKKSAEEEFVLLCHECIHSIQSKALHKLNFVFSNLEILLSIVLFINIFFQSKFLFVNAVFYIAALSIAIIIRIILEKDAVNRSLELFEKCIKREMFKYDRDKVYKLKNKTKKLMPMMYLSLFWKKIVKLFIMMVLIIFR